LENSFCAPFDGNIILNKTMSPTTAKENVEMSKVPYRGAVGTPRWLSLVTRPDISYAVSLVARYSDCFGKEHWQAVKRIFRYLKGSINLSLKYCSVEHSTEFSNQFESLKYLNNSQSVVYKSLHQRTIKDEVICTYTGLVGSDLARCIDIRISVRQLGFVEVIYDKLS